MSNFLDWNPKGQYRHRPLDQNRAEIRLLRVQPRSSPMIHCKVVYVSLEFASATCDPLGNPAGNNLISSKGRIMRSQLSKAMRLSRPNDSLLNCKVSYKALSYAWGDEAASEQILLDGATSHVRPNLFAFLRTLSDPKMKALLSPDDYLWIDAICIDQENVRERNHQVRLVNQIYSKARQVIIWLGESTDRHRDAKLLPLQEEHRHRDYAWLERQKTPSVVSGRLYWTRLWIFQEVLLGTDVTMILGAERIDFDIFHDKELGDHHGSSLYMWRYVNSGATSKPQLIQVAKAFGGQDCRETKNRLFALLSIVSGGLDFPLDYSDTVDVIFWKALHHFNGLYGDGRDDDAAAAGAQLRRLFALKTIQPSPEYSKTVKALPEGPMMSSPKPVLIRGHIPFRQPHKLPSFPRSPEKVAAIRPLFPVRLNLLTDNAFEYLQGFPSISLCTCASCDTLRDLEELLNFTHLLSQRPNHSIYRIPSVRDGLLLFQKPAGSKPAGTWRCIAFIAIIQSLKLYPPSGGGPFDISVPDNCNSCSMLVDATVLRGLLNYDMRPYHDGVVWSMYTKNLGRWVPAAKQSQED